MKKLNFDLLLRYGFFFYLITVPFSLALSDVGIFIVLLACLQLYVSNKNYKIPRLKIMRSFVLFLIAAFFSVIFSINRLHSLVALKELRPFLLLFAVPFITEDEEFERSFERVTLVILTCTAFFSGLQFLAGLNLRIFKKFVSEEHLTLMAMQTFMFSLAFVDVSDEGSLYVRVLKRGLFFLTFILAYIDANIPLFIVLSLISLFKYFSSSNSKSIFLWVVPLLFAIAFGVSERHSDNFLFHLLPGYRSVLITEARSFTKVDPVFGNGYDTFSVLNSLREKRAYSDVITAYVNTGAFGMTALVIFLFDMILLAFRTKNAAKRIGDGSIAFLVIFLLTSFFNPMFFTPHGLRYLVSVWIILESAWLKR